MSRPILTAIAAVDKRLGIGFANGLAWHLPADLKRFKEITSGKMVIMGRKTYDSIGKPLPNRTNVVITRDRNWKADGVFVMHSIEEAVAMATNLEAYVIGGSEIYRQAMPYVGRLLLTEIDHIATCDAFFPEIDHTVWKETSRETHPWVANVDYAFVTYERRPGHHIL